MTKQKQNKTLMKLFGRRRLYESIKKEFMYYLFLNAKVYKAYKKIIKKVTFVFVIAARKNDPDRG